jgi:glycosyltransferase involved in cell wall biosynthesis
VTVNGAWPRQPGHVHSFLNPSFTLQEARQAFSSTKNKPLDRPVRLLFAGRLSQGKGAVRALRVLAELARRGIDARLDFAGDGPCGETLRRLTVELGLEGRVGLPGWLSQTELHSLYRRAHFVVLPSISEGWPKVLSEAMAFGAVPVAGAVSCIPRVMAQIGAGAALPPDDIDALAGAIESLVRDPARWDAHRRNGYASAHLFTYETYVDRVRQLLALDPARSILVPQQAAT